MIGAGVGEVDGPSVGEKVGLGVGKGVAAGNDGESVGLKEEREGRK